MQGTCKKCGKQLQKDEKSICKKCLSNIVLKTQNSSKITPLQILPKSMMHYKIQNMNQLYVKNKQKYLARVPSSRPSAANIKQFLLDFPNSVNVIKGIIKFKYRQKLDEIELNDFSYEEIFMLRHKIDWKYFSTHFENKYPENLVNYIQFINWDKANRTNLSEEYIMYFSQYLDLSKLYPRVLTPRLMEYFESKLDWKYISQIKLNDDIINKYRDKLDWDVLLVNNRLSSEMIIANEDRINFKYLSVLYKEFEEIIYKKYHDRLDWGALDLSNPIVPINLIYEYIDQLNWETMVFRPNLPDKFILEHTDDYTSTRPFYDFKMLEKFMKILNKIDLGIYYPKEGKVPKNYTGRGDYFIYRLFVKLYEVNLILLDETGIVINVSGLCAADYFNHSPYSLYKITPENNIYVLDRDHKVVDTVIQWHPTYPQHQKYNKIQLDFYHIAILLINDVDEYTQVVHLLVEMVQKKNSDYDRFEAFEFLEEIVKLYFDWTTSESYIWIKLLNYR